jgi:tRNA threonylcarbamoyladenosine biosynthesis protein TsaE
MAPVLPLVTANASETRALGEALGPILGAGDVVSLTGDLGAGKTTMVQGIAAALGVAEPVVSPTFTLIREYRGAFPVYHLDVYRLDRIQDVIDLGFDELLDEDALVLIEWGDAIEGLLPDRHLQIKLSISGDDDRRRVAISARGSNWARRWEQVAAAAMPFMHEEA